MAKLKCNEHESWKMGKEAAARPVEHWGRFSHAINLNAFCRLMEMNLVVAMGSYLVKTTTMGSSEARTRAGV